ncbi:MAG: hydantoinase/oxoprolinase family protein [Caldilineales bacterium]|nr:hydantoinase/oxoprolinase family protein [Caldilineales bacterium]
MTIALGIDTGGTYTDAILLDQESDRILASAKALTTYRDLSIGIIKAITAVFADETHACQPEQVNLVSLSTTLATNAMVEDHGSRICLILVGYDRSLIERFGFQKELATTDVVYVQGGHDGLGEEQAELDEYAIREAVAARAHDVEAFAVSGYFGVRNPSHEIRAKAVIEAACLGALGRHLPITCGHDLTSQLDSVRRATTTALNARLIPLLRELIATVQTALTGFGINAPLMVVKGDGSLVQSQWALERPIETILSGPAASAVGAWHLAGREDAWVVDVGGTTTDIVGLREGRPRVLATGATIGRWRTMVEAVDVHTVGLGGDSEISLKPGARGVDALIIGPRRVVPLSLAASMHPEMLDELWKHAQHPTEVRGAGRFLLAGRPVQRQLPPMAQQIVDMVTAGPVSFDTLVTSGIAYHIARLDALLAERVILPCGFTPTDALHALRNLELWDVEAAEYGANIIASRLAMEPQELSEHVIAGVSERVAIALASKAMADHGVVPDWAGDETARKMLAWALDGDQQRELSIQFTLRRPIVAIGVPVEAYLPRTAAALNTVLAIPEHTAVANAVGAVVGSVMQRRNVIIRPLLDDSKAACRVHLPHGVEDFGSVAAGVARAREVMEPLMLGLAAQAGATQASVKMAREDFTIPVAESWGDELWIETVLTFSAGGRPRLG